MTERGKTMHSRFVGWLFMLFVMAGCPSSPVTTVTPYGEVTTYTADYVGSHLISVKAAQVVKPGSIPSAEQVGQAAIEPFAALDHEWVWEEVRWNMLKAAGAAATGSGNAPEVSAFLYQDSNCAWGVSTYASMNDTFKSPTVSRMDRGTPRYKVHTHPDMFSPPSSTDLAFGHMFDDSHWNTVQGMKIGDYVATTRDRKCGDMLNGTVVVSFDAVYYIVATPDLLGPHKIIAMRKQLDGAAPRHFSGPLTVETYECTPRFTTKKDLSGNPIIVGHDTPDCTGKDLYKKEREAKKRLSVPKK